MNKPKASYQKQRSSFNLQMSRKPNADINVLNLSNNSKSNDSVLLEQDKTNQGKRPKSSLSQGIDQDKNKEEKSFNQNKKPVVPKKKESYKPKLPSEISSKLGLSNGSFNSHFGLAAKQNSISAKMHMEMYKKKERQSLYENDISEIQSETVEGQIPLSGNDMENKVKPSKSQISQNLKKSGRYIVYENIVVEESNLIEKRIKEGVLIETKQGLLTRNGRMVLLVENEEDWQNYMRPSIWSVERKELQVAPVKRKRLEISCISVEIKAFERKVNTIVNNKLLQVANSAYVEIVEQKIEAKAVQEKRLLLKNKKQARIVKKQREQEKRIELNVSDDSFVRRVAEKEEESKNNKLRKDSEISGISRLEGNIFNKRRYKSILGEEIVSRREVDHHSFIDETEYDCLRRKYAGQTSRSPLDRKARPTSFIGYLKEPKVQLKRSPIKGNSFVYPTNEIDFIEMYSNKYV